MTEHSPFCYPGAPFTNGELPLLSVAARHFDKVVTLDRVGASWATVRADRVARDTITLLKNAGIREGVTPADLLAKYGDPFAKAVRRETADRALFEPYDYQVQGRARQRSTFSLARTPRHVLIFS